MGVLSLIPQSLKNIFARPTAQVVAQGWRTFTESSPAFSSWDGTLYEQAQTRSIIECIANHCSKLKPEFVTPEGSQGSMPPTPRLFSARPNDMMTWPVFIKRVMTFLYADTTTYIVPGYDERDPTVVTSLWPLKPAYAEVLEYEGEPWIRFTLVTGDVMAYPFYDVGILTRFQLDSDIFGGGNEPLTPTLRLMDAQRQAEEIALKTGANIRFIGKLAGLVHEKNMNEKRDRFSETNLGVGNKSGLLLYDQTFEEIKQIEQNPYVSNEEQQERIDKALYAYFGINESILTNNFNDEQWAAFYEGCIEVNAIMLGSTITKMLLTPTQVRKGNHIMFSSGYLEYSTPDTKLKVISNMMDRGVFSFNQALDVLQLPHIPGGDLRMIRGEYYLVDEQNNIIAESGGKGTDHSTTYYGEDDDDNDDNSWDDDSDSPPE